MFEQTLAIVRNTFLESIRQPVVFVLLVAATLLIVLSNPLSTFTMSDDQRMLIDIGLATIFLFGALLAALVATSVLTREIDNRTALTVVSKPVGRPVFVIGKYLGVALALLLATAYMTFVFLLVEHHGVLQTVRDPIHLPAVAFGFGAVLLGLLTGVWCNYFYGRVFASTVIVVTTPLVALAYLLSLMFDHDFTPVAIAQNLDGQLWRAVTLLFMAVLVLSAVAIAASTRLGQAMTLVVTLVVFIGGMLSDWVFGRRLAAIRHIWFKRAEAEGLAEVQTVAETIHLTTGETAPLERVIETADIPLYRMAEAGELGVYALCKAAYTVIPNFQVMLLTDAVNQRHVIPGSYVVQSLVYGVLLIIALLSLAVALFQRREVG